MAGLKTSGAGGKIAIGPCALADASALASLHGQCFENGWSSESFAAFIGDSPCVALKATTGQPNAVVGLVVARVGSDEAEILTLAVAPDCRRRRIAETLIKETVEILVQWGIRRLFLEVSAANEAAGRLYANLGFAQYGTRRNYYRRPNRPPEDALCLSLDLDSR